MADGKQRKGGGDIAGLVGAGPSQVGTGGAMRARDAARPRPKDLTRAERTVVLRRQRSESS